MNKPHYRSRVQYLVTWKGYPLYDATWELLSNLMNCHDKVEAFKMPSMSSFTCVVKLPTCALENRFSTFRNFFTTPSFYTHHLLTSRTTGIDEGSHVRILIQDIHFHSNLVNALIPFHCYLACLNRTRIEKVEFSYYVYRNDGVYG